MKQALLLLLLTPILHAQDMPPAKVFQINCSACHAVDKMVVGPSMIEMARIYKGKPDEFVKWCIEPQPKRPGAIEMPSMAHLGEDTLRKLLPYILKETEGKKEVIQKGEDPYAIPAAMLKRPQVQRMFLPDASPAAIAVALPGDLSYCFDAGKCRLRYVWKGGFIDGWPYWRSNGSSMAKIDGEKIYTEETFTFSTLTKKLPPPPKFHGYSVDKEGLPTFRYSHLGINWTETIKPLADGTGIERHFTCDLTTPLLVNEQEGVEITSSTGSLKISAEQAKSFTLTYRFK